MKIYTPVVCTAVAAAVLVGCGGGVETEADLVLTGGWVWNGPNAPVAAAEGPTAIAVDDGKVLAVGSDAEIARYAGASTERIDLAGRRVVPGLMDSHTHFVVGGLELASVQLRDAATPEEFSRRIGEFAASHPDGWIIGGTWDHELWGGELPRRDWIDEATPDTPVFVSRLDGHMALANTRALELAGVTKDTVEPPGGTIVRYPDGRPTGILKDEAMGLVLEAMPAPSEDERDRALAAAVQYAVERGVTMITDMGTWEDLETYRRAAARGELPIRVYSVVPIATWERLKEFVDGEGRGDHRLFWGGLKGFVDGSLGSTTAWFYQPYDDEPDTAGLVVIEDEAEFRSWITGADAAGLHVVIHAIGDLANDWLLDAYAEAREANGPRDRRFRIEHAQHLTRAAIDRMAAEDVIPSMQPYHAIDDGRWAEKRIGPERIKTTYAFRSLLDAGAALAFGSDWTVAPIDPLFGIYAAVTRRTFDGANPGGWVPEEKITVADAVAAYTSGVAYASFLEDVVGELKPGKYADLVVLSDDIFTVDPVEIENVSVDLTMVEGEIVYRRVD
jgi:predicted amidohydrolase YtcJ